MIAYRQLSCFEPCFDGKVAIEGIIKFAGGGFLRIFTDGSWRGTHTFIPGWENIPFNDSGWKNLKDEGNVAMSTFSLHPENTTAMGLLADPPYFGPIEIKTGDHENHIFQQGVGVKLDIELPLECRVSTEYSDAFTGNIISSGDLTGTIIGGIYSFPFFFKPSEPGVYNLKISAFHKDKLFDTRFYETAVIGKNTSKRVSVERYGVRSSVGAG